MALEVTTTIVDEEGVSHGYRTSKFGPSHALELAAKISKIAGAGIDLKSGAIRPDAIAAALLEAGHIDLVRQLLALTVRDGAKLTAVVIEQVYHDNLGEMIEAAAWVIAENFRSFFGIGRRLGPRLGTLGAIVASTSSGNASAATGPSGS